jgi:dihydropteridine reductase
MTLMSKVLTSGSRRFLPRIPSAFQKSQQCHGFSTYEYDNESSSRKKTALVLGSSGWLGKKVVQHLVELNLQVIGADVCELPNESDSGSLDGFVTVPNLNVKPSLADITTALVTGVSEILGEEEQIDVIICANGGWQPDPEPPRQGASAEEVIAGAKAYGETIDRMMHMNLYPVTAAGYVANQFMAEEGQCSLLLFIFVRRQRHQTFFLTHFYATHAGLFVVMGATAALSSTPGMIGYGLSKVGSHHFVQTLGETTLKAVTSKAKRNQTKRLRKHGEYLDTLSIIGILPTTIDTPSNRDAMPDADFSKWTKASDVAKEIGTWITKPVLRPHSGSLVKVFPSVDGGSGASFQLVR